MINNIVNYRFINESSRQCFEGLWRSFMMRHRRDVHQTYSQNFLLPDVKPKMTFYIGAKPASYRCYLVLWTLVGMAWPFSMWVESKISRFNVEYMKILTL